MTRSPASGWQTRGQPAPLEALVAAVARDAPPQALLLVGPARVGKTTLALDLAAALLCTASAPAERPCRACAACHRVERGTHPDLHRLAPSGAGDQIRLGEPGDTGTVRALLGDLALRPFEGRYRVAIIERAQRLNQDAQNALLKLLEEPPSGAVICLTADDEGPLLDTLVSRCIRLRLGTVDGKIIAGLLAERGLADGTRGQALARAGAGRPGLALALAAAPEALLVEGRLVRQLLDLLVAPPAARLAAAPGLIADGAALAALAEGTVDDRGADREAEAVEVVALTDGGGEGPVGGGRPSRRSAHDRRLAVRRVLETWRSVGRELAVAAAGGRAELRRIDLLEELTAAAPGLAPARLAAFLGRLEGLDQAVAGYADPELALDALLLAWPSPRPAA